MLCWAQRCGRSSRLRPSTVTVQQTVEPSPGRVPAVVSAEEQRCSQGNPLQCVGGDRRLSPGGTGLPRRLSSGTFPARVARDSAQPLWGGRSPVRSRGPRRCSGESLFGESLIPLVARGHGLQVAAPSKLLRSFGDRGTTDERDVQPAAMPAHNDAVTGVRIPCRDQEAVRDAVRARRVVRARHCTRIALMSARHRVSTLLRRPGHVSHSGRARDCAHGAWMCRRPRHPHGGRPVLVPGHHDPRDAHRRRSRARGHVGGARAEDAGASIVGNPEQGGARRTSQHPPAEAPVPR